MSGVAEGMPHTGLGCGVAPAEMLPRTLRALQRLASEGAAMLGRRAHSPTKLDQPICVEQLTAFYLGRRDRVQRTLSLFRSECENLLELLRASIDAPDLARAAAAAHRLKGAASTATAERVREAAERVEHACQRKETSEVLAAFAELRREAHRAIDWIANELALPERRSETDQSRIAR